MGIQILGTGSYTPDRILTNQDLEKMVETSDEWITTRTGIKERHIAPPEMPNSDMAVAAARNALENAGKTIDDIDLIVVATASGDYRFPSTACVVQGKLGASKCTCFDVGGACSGFLYSIDIATNILRGHREYRNAIVIGSEKLSFMTDWNDRGTCVLFGDAAGAVILGRTEDADSDFLLAAHTGSDGQQAKLIYQPNGGTANPSTPENLYQHEHFLNMMGPEVFKQAVPAMVNASKHVLAQAGVESSALSWVVPHQANKRIIDAVATRLGVESERVYVNIERYGNTSAASIGVCIDEMNRKGLLKRGDLVLLTAFGSGLTWAATLLKW